MTSYVLIELSLLQYWQEVDRCQPCSQAFRYRLNLGHLDKILRTRRASLAGDFDVPDTEKVPWSGCTHGQKSFTPCPNVLTRQP